MLRPMRCRSTVFYMSPSRPSTNLCSMLIHRQTLLLVRSPAARGIEAREPTSEREAKCDPPPEQLKQARGVSVHGRREPSVARHSTHHSRRCVSDQATMLEKKLCGASTIRLKEQAGRVRRISRAAGRRASQRTEPPGQAPIRLIEKEGLSTVTDACAVSGIGHTKLYEAIGAGQLEARKYGKRTLILRDDLLRFLTSLPTV